MAYFHKHNVAILYPALTTRLENNPSLLKVFRMMIIIVMFYRLPSYIDHIAIVQAVHGLNYLASGDASAAINVPDDVCPQWPCVLPCSICPCVDGCSDRIAEELRAERVS